MGQVLHSTLQEFADLRKKKCVDEKFEDPKVSIIVPIYNVEPYIDECLNSLVRQTIKELEFICIDDGSVDNSYKILEQYAKYDASFMVLKQNREGQGIGRNKCIELAKGKYIAFVDLDASIPRYIEQVKNYLSAEDYEHFDKL